MNNIFIGLLILLPLSTALPVKEKQPELTPEQQKEELKDEPPVLQDWELSLEYGRYLKEVIQALESDSAFRKKLEEAEADDIKSGKIARELHFVDHNIRTKLDELKRRELERIRHLAVQANELSNGLDHKNLKIPVHLDHKNPTRFEVEDLRKLIKQTSNDLEKMDEQRKKDFSRYEMEKEFEYKQKLAEMTPEERKKAELEHEEQMKKHKDHPKLHHPGSKQQLEQVWEEEDHMNKEEFNPKTFFHLHDLDGNGHWDENEVKALFLKELEKAYDPNATEDDLMERDEEMERMREHIFAEADTNDDDLISFDEFLEQTRRNEFERDEGWQTLDEQELYSQQEYEQYQQQRLLELQAAGLCSFMTVIDLLVMPDTVLCSDILSVMPDTVLCSDNLSVMLDTVLCSDNLSVMPDTVLCSDNLSVMPDSPVQ
ncbi:EF-hand domain pair [Trinorchestia longiramus]|nr:EF-hand domain pair [Trinorchestia longiramus]